MAIQINLRRTALPWLAVVAAGLLIGCGGLGDLGFMRSTTGGGGSATTPPGGYVSGTLPADSILYSVESDSGTQIRAIGGDGQNDRIYASLPPGFGPFAPSPVTADWLFAWSPNGTDTRLYRNTVVSDDGASPLFETSFGVIYTVQITPDGRHAVFAASSDFTTTSLYVVNLMGAEEPRLLDVGDHPSLSPNGSMVAYSKPNASGSSICVMPVTGGASTAITSSGSDVLPQWSRDGQKIVFSGNRGDDNFDLYSVKPDGTGLTRLTSTPLVSELGASYNSLGTLISYVGIVGVDATAGLYRMAAGGGPPTLLKATADMGVASYWTSPSGRLQALFNGLGQRLRVNLPR